LYQNTYLSAYYLVFISSSCIDSNCFL